MTLGFSVFPFSFPVHFSWFQSFFLFIPFFFGNFLFVFLYTFITFEIIQKRVLPTIRFVEAVYFLPRFPPPSSTLSFLFAVLLIPSFWFPNYLWSLGFYPRYSCSRCGFWANFGISSSLLSWRRRAVWGGSESGEVHQIISLACFRVRISATSAAHKMLTAG